MPKNFDSPINIDTSTKTLTSSPWQQRLSRAIKERRLMARFWACLFLLVGCLYLSIAVYFARHYLFIGEMTEVPRWVYLQSFVGLIHILYGILMLQVPDWSTLKGVSIVSLAISFLMGTMATGLWIGESGGIIAGVLELAQPSTDQGIIWCAAMLCLSILLSYGCAKEAFSWQRAEELLLGILNQNADRENSAV